MWSGPPSNILFMPGHLALTHTGTHHKKGHKNSRISIPLPRSSGSPVGLSLRLFPSLCLGLARWSKDIALLMGTLPAPDALTVNIPSHRV